MKNILSKLTSKEKILSLFIIIVLFKFSFFLGMGISLYSTQDEVNNLKEYKSTYLYRSGSTSVCSDGYIGEEFKSYNIVSLDGGLNWYEYKSADNGGIDIIESVDSTFVECLKGWEELSDYVLENGTIKVGEDTTGTKLLENLGFTIEEK